MRPATRIAVVATGALLLLSTARLVGGSSPGASEGDADFRDPLEIAISHVLDHHDRLGLTLADLDDVELASSYTSGHSGTTHIALRQRYDGIRVHDALLTVSVARDGRVINVGNRFVPGLARRIDGPGVPGFGAAEAVRMAATHLGLELRAPLEPLAEPEDPDSRRRFGPGGVSRSEIPVRLVYQPLGPIVRLTWEVRIHERRGGDAWSVWLDAVTGEEVDRSNLTAHHRLRSHPASFPVLGTQAAACGGSGDGDDDFCVYDMPVESPLHASAIPDGSERAVESDPWERSSSAWPGGWNDIDGTPGAESDLTVGNNADAHKGGTRADGGANRIFNFQLDFTSDPDTGTNVDAALTNVYYWTNVLHDLWSDYGFDPPAGNFQENDYGVGGVGGDRIDAHVQSSGNCDAQFTTPADGTSPTMSTFLCDIVDPPRDGSLDNGLNAHLFWHGMANRLTAGPAEVSCLDNAESPIEGWGDLGALLMTIEPGDSGSEGRGLGTYVIGQGPSDPGIRSQHYSTSLLVNNHTYGDLGPASTAFEVGEVWASIIWEVVWALIDTYGFNPDLYDDWDPPVGSGNNLAAQLIIDGLKLQPCDPGFVDARDAILAAEMTLTGGANQCLLWEAFAKRGLGGSADQGSPEETGDETEAFDIPPCGADPEIFADGFESGNTDFWTATVP